MFSSVLLPRTKTSHRIYQNSNVNPQRQPHASGYLPGQLSQRDAVPQYRASHLNPRDLFLGRHFGTANSEASSGFMLVWLFVFALFSNATIVSPLYVVLSFGLLLSFLSQNYVSHSLLAQSLVLVFPACFVRCQLSSIIRPLCHCQTTVKGVSSRRRARASGVYCRLRK